MIVCTWIEGALVARRGAESNASIAHYDVERLYE